LSLPMARRMVGGFFFVLCGNTLRLGSGLLVTVLLARQLGPAGFGSFAYPLALATLAVVPLNFGLATVVLRRFGVAPKGRAEAMAEALSAKLLLCFPLLVVCLFAAWFLPTAVAAVWAPLLLAQTAESFAELYQLGFRAADRYEAEAGTAAWVSMLHILLMAVAVWQLPTAVACAWFFFLSRLLGLMVTAWRAQRAYAKVRLAGLRDAFRVLREAKAYALEYGLNTVAAQLDSVLIEAHLGLRSLGLYQAGMKLVQGLSRLAPILALYLLPRVARGIHARVSEGQPGAGPQVLLTLAVFGGFGAIAGTAIALAAVPLTRVLFGTGYSELAALLPWFGLLLALRFLETGAGVVLVAADLQSRKVWLVALQLALLLGLGSWALSRWGLIGWLAVAIGTTVILLLLYVWLWSQAAVGSRSPAERDS
jgi:O-antigen/teichoic acid export membrane protein